MNFAGDSYIILLLIIFSSCTSVKIKNSSDQIDDGFKTMRFPVGDIKFPAIETQGAQTKGQLFSAGCLTYIGDSTTIQDESSISRLISKRETALSIETGIQAELLQIIDSLDLKIDASVLQSISNTKTSDLRQLQIVQYDIAKTKFRLSDEDCRSTIANFFENDNQIAVQKVRADTVNFTSDLNINNEIVAKLKVAFEALKSKIGIDFNRQFSDDLNYQYAGYDLIVGYNTLPLKVRREEVEIKTTKSSYNKSFKRRKNLLTYVGMKALPEDSDKVVVSVIYDGNKSAQIPVTEGGTNNRPWKITSDEVSKWIIINREYDEIKGDKVSRKLTVRVYEAIPSIY